MVSFTNLECDVFSSFLFGGGVINQCNPFLKRPNVFLFPSDVRRSFVNKFI